MSSSRLAIDGGAPVRATLLPYGRQSIEEDDVQAVVDVLRGPYLTTGPSVDAFELAFAQRQHVPNAIAVSSGTAALHAAVGASRLGPEDEIITSPMTFCATSNAVLFEGATPVFADVSPDTLNVDPERVAARIGPRTRAILAVDFAGHPADLVALRELARQRGLFLMEDACHSLGATLDGQPSGALADLAAFSFHPVKHVATGEGGMVTAHDPEVVARLRRFRSHGIGRGAREREAAGDWFYEMSELGYNYRLSDLACALGISQLAKLDANIARRRAIVAHYVEAFAAEPALTLPPERPGARSAWHLYPVRLNLAALTVDRAHIFRALRAEGLGVNVHYIPVHLHPYYRERFGSGPGDFPVCEDAYERMISLPLFHAMTDSDLADVVEAVNKVLAHYRR